MYGWRGRIGLLVPTGNIVMEPEFNRMAPDGLSVHANRVYLKSVTPEHLKGMAGEAEDAAGALVSCRLGQFRLNEPAWAIPSQVGSQKKSGVGSGRSRPIRSCGRV